MSASIEKYQGRITEVFGNGLYSRGYALDRIETAGGSSHVVFARDNGQFRRFVSVHQTGDGIEVGYVLMHGKTAHMEDDYSLTSRPPDLLGLVLCLAEAIMIGEKYFQVLEEHVMRKHG